MNHNSCPVFIYSVGGRTGSTALQRLLNSSGQICIYGESQGFIDQYLLLLASLLKMDSQSLQQLRRRDLDRLKLAIVRNKHSEFYANANYDLRSIIQELTSLLKTTYRPLVGNRFGFKEINVVNGEVLYMLKSIFCDCYFIFIYRKPIPQFVSVKASGYFKYSTNCELFLREYERLSYIYLTYHKETGEGIFVENEKLKCIDFVRSLFSELGLTRLDASLIDDGLDSTRECTLLPEEEELILHAEATKFYNKMVDQSSYHNKRLNKINCT